MSLKIEWHSKWNDTQDGISIKMECQLKWNVTPNGMLLKKRMYFKIEFAKWIVTQNETSLKME